jgi:hypothetical protein
MSLKKLELKDKRMSTEKFTVSGEELLAKIKQIIHEGNIRRVRIIHDNKTIIEIPLSIGAPIAAIGILAAPVLAAIGAFAALITECTIEVEKMNEDTIQTDDYTVHQDENK